MSPLRLLGALCVAASCGAWGLMQLLVLRREAAVYPALCKTLELLHGEITQLRTPLPELFSRLAREAPALCRPWLEALCQAMETRGEESFSRLWRQSLEAGRPFPLEKEALERLCLLGLSLGRYDAPEQGESIRRCLRDMEAAQARAAERARVQGRLRGGLGISAGLLLAILLL